MYARGSGQSRWRSNLPGPIRRRPRATLRIRAIAFAAFWLGLTADPAASQDVLDRTPNVSGGWVGIPWTLHVELPHRFRDGNREPGAGIDRTRTTTFTGSFALPWRSLAGLAYAVQSPTVPGEPDELQPFVRHRLLDGDRAPLDLALTAAWNEAAGSFDAEALVARRLGPLRLMGAARWFSDARGTGDDRAVLAAGAVWNPFPRRAPIALAGDVAVPLDRPGADLEPGGADDEDLAWGGALQVGIPHTALTLSLHLTNTAATTLQGASFADTGTRYGFELTVPIPVGFFLGTYPARERARQAVVAEPEGALADAVVDIRRYAYGPVRIVVRPGAVVEWVNRDDVVHTATAEDAAWNSEAIPPGESWRARFDDPGIYPYYCGPHPFMKAVVIVR